ncbi:MAG: hypothetical protein L0Z63_09955, partial [Actinobacteria bacterium]|nr:hypothetical protein [Actinomycetota bacterium]
ARQHILDHASSEARYWMGRAAAAEDLLTSLSNRRSVRVADAVGSIIRARSGNELRRAFRSLWNSLGFG